MRIHYTVCSSTVSSGKFWLITKSKFLPQRVDFFNFGAAIFGEFLNFRAQKGPKNNFSEEVTGLVADLIKGFIADVIEGPIKDLLQGILNDYVPDIPTNLVPGTKIIFA